MNLQDISEIVTGLVLNHRLSPETVDVTKLMSPYGEVVVDIQNGKTLEDIVNSKGLEPVKVAIEAAEALGNKVPADWSKILDLSYREEWAARLLERQVKRLRRGEGMDVSAVTEALEAVTSGGLEFTTADKVDPEEAVWLATQYEPLDRHLGGVVKSGLNIFAAPPGTGKTALLLKLISAKAKEHKYTLLFSVEMTSGQIVKRLLEISDLTMEERAYIILVDQPVTITDICTMSTRLAALFPLEYIAVDFADLVLDDDEDEANVTQVYRKLTRLAKKLKIAVLLLAQLSREYVGGIPKIHHIRWSGLAEALGALIILIYNPKRTFSNMGKDERLPLVYGIGYLIVGKSRFGSLSAGEVVNGVQKRGGGIGAIPVGWDGGKAWDDDSGEWISLE
jgi:hypothetical protein